MKFLTLFFVISAFLMLNAAYGVSSYEAPKDDINTNTGTFIVPDNEVKLPSEKPLQMQKEEEVELDSFGQDEYNENVDPDSFDDNDTF